MSPEERIFPARLDCRYLLRPGEAGGALIVALHGFSANPEVMLRLIEQQVGPRHAIASVEGPFAFFTDPQARNVGYGWVTHHRSADAIRLHHDMVQHTLEEAGRELGIPAERRILLGFSQPVSLNYRFAVAYPGLIRGVVGLCGGLPGDWNDLAPERIDAAVLHVARRADEYYPVTLTEQFPARLRLRCEDVEFHQLEGGHRVPSEGAPLIQRWFDRLLR
jgi:phospholipase/carboxylesterase